MESNRFIYRAQRFLREHGPGRPALRRSLKPAVVKVGYTPLLPALVSAGWFDTGAAAYLGAANLAGYLCGALLAGIGPLYLAARWLLRGAMVLATVSLVACAWPLGFAWFFIWRLLSGVAGSLAMVLAAPTILPHIPRRRHGMVGGAIFVGVGAGITLSGTLVPLLLQTGLTRTWLGLALLSAITTMVGWGGCLMSFLLQSTGGDYHLLYVLAAGTMVVALILDRTVGSIRAAA